jgi:hypothetical protein
VALTGAQLARSRTIPGMVEGSRRESADSVADPLKLIAENAGSLGKLGAIVSAVSAAGLIYVLGGLVVAVRLSEIGLPVEEALAVIPKERLLLIGIRESLVGVAVGLGFLVVSRLTWFWVGPIAALLVLVVPFTVGGLLWPASMLAFVALAKRIARPGGGLTAVAVTLATVVAVGIVVVGRYRDPPLGLPVAQVARTDTELPECGPGVEKKMTCGAYLAATSEGIFIAGPERDSITFLPKDRLKHVDLYPPPDAGPPRRSLFGRITSRFWRPIALTPLDWWIGTRHYGFRLLS